MQNSQSASLINIKMLNFIASKLGPLCNEFVFLGGCTTALFITDPAFPDVRYTLDVDCIVDVISLTRFRSFYLAIKRPFDIVVMA
jgi:hypothetical protein